MTITLYGIKNCDTVKKARNWLDANGVDYQFHDFKTMGVPGALITHALSLHGWNTVLNTRGTTWRALPADVKDNMDDKAALALAIENPSIIKRPLLEREGAHALYFGFSPEAYAKIFS